MSGSYFYRFTAFILAFYFLFAGLWYGKSFFIPFTVAAVLAMLVVPINEKLESRGWNKALATSISVLILVLVVSGFFYLLIVQLGSFMQDMQGMQQKLSQMVQKVQQWLHQKLNLSTQEQQKYLSSGTSNLSKFAKSFVTGFFATSADFLLMMVYVFCFLFYRKKLKKFVIKLVPENKQQEGKEILGRTSKIARSYLVGRLILIVILAILYYIGLSIIGLRNALFISMFAAVFSLIPYFGNIIGFATAAAVALISGKASDVIGVAVVFSIAQLLESYILEPTIVGDKVNINPFVVIVAVVIGGILWGTAGMVIAIPITGILKVVFQHVPALNPYGFLLGQTEKGGFEEKIEKKVKGWFQKIFNKK